MDLEVDCSISITKRIVERCGTERRSCTVPHRSKIVYALPHTEHFGQLQAVETPDLDAVDADRVLVSREAVVD